MIYWTDYVKLIKIEIQITDKIMNFICVCN